MKKQTLLLRKLAHLTGQSVIEYFVIFTVILAAVLSTGVIERVRNGFEGYFNTAVERLR